MAGSDNYEASRSLNLRTDRWDYPSNEFSLWVPANPGREALILHSTADADIKIYFSPGETAIGVDQVALILKPGERYELTGGWVYTGMIGSQSNATTGALYMTEFSK